MAELGLGQRHELLKDVEAAPACSTPQGRRLRTGLTAAPQPPIGPCAAERLAESVAQPTSRESWPQEAVAASCGTSKRPL